MIKKTSSLLLIIAGLVLSNEVIKHDYVFDSPVVIDNIVCVKGCRTARQGFEPMVAVKPVVLLLQNGHEAVSFEVEYGDCKVLDGEYYIKPFTPSINLSSKPCPELYKTRQSSIYDNNEFYPSLTRSGWFSMQYKNGHPIFHTAINPVQYNPVTGKIRFYTTVSIKVSTQPVRSASHYKCTPAIKSRLKDLIDNPEAAENLLLTGKDADDYEYLIITMNALKDSWSALVEFNKRRGLRTQIQTIDYIKTNGTGRDDAEKVRDYIISQYKNNNIEYVLLGGDADPGISTDLPDRAMHAYFYDCVISPERYYDEKDITADMYFSTLDGDWKKDKTGAEKPYFGDPGTEDMYWDVYACRLPVDNATDINSMVNKIIKYSENPVMDLSTKLFLAGQFLWNQWGATVWGGDHMEEFVGTCTKNGYTTNGFPASMWAISKMYEKDASWTITQFRDRVNTFKPAIIEHLGHGNTTLAFNETNAGVTTTNYKNNGVNANFFILTTGACYPGNFDNASECLMEQFLKISNGAVATQAFTRTGMEDDNGTDGVGQRIRRFFHDAIFNTNKKIHHLEMALASGKESNAEIVLNPSIETPPYFGALRFTTYGLNNMGDPALSIWTETPKTFTPDYPTPLTSTTFQWNTKYPYTWVALCDETGAIITTQLTGKDGLCKIEDDVLKAYVTAHPSGTLKVRVKAHNFLPFEGDLPIQVTSQSNAMHDKFPVVNNISHTGTAVKIIYDLPAGGFITISIYNSKGELIKTLVNELQRRGNHRVSFNGNGSGNGCYYCRIKFNNKQNVKKFVLSN